MHPRFALVAAFVCLCGCGTDEIGERMPESDALCAAPRPHAYRPRDMERAKAAGCAIAWRMDKDGSERSAFCCP